MGGSKCVPSILAQGNKRTDSEGLAIPRTPGALAMFWVALAYMCKLPQLPSAARSSPVTLSCQSF
eukprot:1209437-Amphidinium_carterae.1